MQKNLILRTTFFLLIVCNYIFAYSSDGKETLTSENFQSTDTLQIIAESESFFKKGKLFYDKEEYAAAIDCFLKSDSVINAYYGTDSPYYGYGQRWTSSCYHKLGLDSIAQSYSVYFDKDPIDKMLTHISDSVIWIALKLEESGQTHKALEKILEAAKLEEQELGQNNYWYVNTLCYCAGLYSEIGQFEKAIELGTYVTEYYKANFGTHHPNYALSLSNLSTFYSDLGNTSEAIKLEEKALEIEKTLNGTRNLDYANKLSNLAEYYSAIGNYSVALHLGEEAMNIRKNVLGTEHSDYALSLICLADYYSAIGNISKALLLGTEAMEIWKKLFGTNHPYYATSIFRLSGYYLFLGNITKAVQLGTEALEIRKSIHGSGHPNFALSLSWLASLYASIGDYAKSYSFLKQYIVSSQPYILNSFVELSPNLRESLWTRKFASNYNKLFPYIVEKNMNKESISELYDNTCLFAKGILLNTDIVIRNLILESGDSSLIKKYNALSSNISIYNKLIETPINKRLINADSLSSVIQRQEMELANKSKAYGDYAHNLTINWRDVQGKLGDDDIAIEFLDFPIINTDSTLYVALTLKRGYDSPRMVTLFEKKQLNAIPSNVYYTRTDVAGLVWKPLENELKGVKNIYFSPSGELHRIGIEYLPISKTENICDVYTLHRLSSTRQLAIVQDEIKGNNAILYGGINYDDKSKTISADSASENKTPYRTASIYRTIVDSLTLRNSYDYLEGTKKEVDLIVDDMKKHRVPYNYYNGTYGTEESFKKLDGTKPKVMHIATHGFYLTEEEAEKTRFARPELDLLSDGGNNASRQIEHKPMTRSGLLFSGCNHAIHHEQIPDGEEDGILTAQEISTLDLRGLDLVVLSACQTGLGDIISGEGVFGLQRGFKKAGAKTIIMSLWNVNDESTMKMMTSFYHYYLEGMSKESAFHAAQEELRKDCSPQQERPDWAAFIMLDGLN